MRNTGIQILQALLLAGLLATGTAASAMLKSQVNTTALACHSEPTEDFLTLAAEMRDLEAVDIERASVEQCRTVQDIVVPVYFHDVFENSPVEESKIRRDFSELSAAFSPHGISFKLKAIDHIQNTAWYNMDAWYDPQAREMQRALRKGGYGSLNIFYKGVKPGLAGARFCTLPDPRADTLRDGCYVTPSIGSKVIIHEVGHWLGLLHTFQQQKHIPIRDPAVCDNAAMGDFVDDTPAHILLPGDDGNCDRMFDTCPGQPGADPRRNYMTYGDMECLTEFTKGQEVRMKNMHRKLREGRE